MSMSENSEDIKKAKREYYRKWRKQNPDKVQAAQERYWRRKLEEQKRDNPGIPDNYEIR